LKSFSKFPAIRVAEESDCGRGAIGIHGYDHYKVGRFWQQVYEIDVIAMNNVIDPARDIGPVDLNDISGGLRRGCPGNTCGQNFGGSTSFLSQLPDLLSELPDWAVETAFCSKMEIRWSRETRRSRAYQLGAKLVAQARAK
jgi:hypothetical protein